MKEFDDYQLQKDSFRSAAADLKTAAAALHNAIDQEVKQSVLSGAQTLGVVDASPAKSEPANTPDTGGAPDPKASAVAQTSTNA